MCACLRACVHESARLRFVCMCWKVGLFVMVVARFDGLFFRLLSLSLDLLACVFVCSSGCLTCKQHARRVTGRDRLHHLTHCHSKVKESIGSFRRTRPLSTCQSSTSSPLLLASL